MNIGRWEIILFYIGIYFGVNELFLLFRFFFLLKLFF